MAKTLNGHRPISYTARWVPWVQLVTYQTSDCNTSEANLTGYLSLALLSREIKLMLTRSGRRCVTCKTQTPNPVRFELYGNPAVSRMILDSTIPLLASNGSILTASRPFNSLFKVLFIFPSRYLFAIGLVPIFSFRWNLPPIFGCIPKQPDSWRTLRIGMPRHAQRGSHPLWRPVPRNLNVCRAPSKMLL